MEYLAAEILSQQKTDQIDTDAAAASGAAAATAAAPAAAAASGKTKGKILFGGIFCFPRAR